MGKHFKPIVSEVGTIIDGVLGLWDVLQDCRTEPRALSIEVGCLVGPSGAVEKWIFLEDLQLGVESPFRSQLTVPFRKLNAEWRAPWACWH